MKCKNREMRIGAKIYLEVTSIEVNSQILLRESTKGRNRGKMKMGGVGVKRDSAYEG